MWGRGSRARIKVVDRHPRLLAPPRLRLLGAWREDELRLRMLGANDARHEGPVRKVPNIVPLPPEADGEGAEEGNRGSSSGDAWQRPHQHQQRHAEPAKARQAQSSRLVHQILKLRHDAREAGAQSEVQAHRLPQGDARELRGERDERALEHIHCPPYRLLRIRIAGRSKGGQVGPEEHKGVGSKK